MNLIFYCNFYDSGSSSFTLVKFYLVGYGDEEVSVRTAFYNLVRSFREGNFRISMPDGDSCGIDINSLQSKFIHISSLFLTKQRFIIHFVMYYGKIPKSFKYTVFSFNFIIWVYSYRRKYKTNLFTIHLLFFLS